jgi:hypothetical protein
MNATGKTEWINIPANYRCIGEKCPLCPEDKTQPMVGGCSFYPGYGYCTSEKYGEKIKK